MNRRVLVPVMDWSHPAGGMRKLYRHVDVLNANDIPAFIVHQQPGFRCTWFKNQTAVTHSSSPEHWPPRAGDVLMVPEFLAWQFLALAPGVPKVIFSQNAFQTFENAKEPFRTIPYTHSDTLASIVVSDHSREYLEYAFPGHRVFRIHYSVDPKLFYFEPNKKRRIALMPRKNEFEMKQVVMLLDSRGLLKGFEIARIHDQSQEQAAAALCESMIFLSFSTYEGWGLPPMEAIACGCITIGHDGGGGREFLREPYAISVVPEDVLGYAKTVENVIRQVNQDPGPLLEKAKAASEFILSTYTPQREEQDIVRTWKEIFALSGL
jgi:glycosyltransferase involved in cell wall biosynthesis